MKVCNHLCNNKILTEFQGTWKSLLLLDAFNTLIRVISIYFMTKTLETKRLPHIPKKMTTNLIHTVLLAVESAHI